MAYKFLDEVYDTPYSLPKPKAKENIVFNFRKDHFKIFHLVIIDFVFIIPLAGR